MSGKWKKVANVLDLQPGVPITVDVDDGPVMVVEVEGTIHACGGECTHQGGPLAEGVLDGKEVTCPWHQARFDVTTGQLVQPPALESVGCWEVKIEGDDVMLGQRKTEPKPMPLGRKRDTFVIIGGGAAGHFAAQTLRHEGFDGRLVMITAESDRPYDRTVLSKTVLEGRKHPDKAYLFGENYYSDLEVEILYDHRVASLDVAMRELTFGDGKKLAFNRALLATGGVPRVPAIGGANLHGFFVLRSLADARRIVERLKDAGTVMILGASFIGLEAAASLVSRGLEVHVAAPEKVPMGRVFGDKIGVWLQDRHERAGVEFHLGLRATRLLGSRQVEAAELSDGTVLECDLVLAGVGIDPAVGYLKDTELVVDGAVPVDGRLETRAPGIFAAGDIASVFLPNRPPLRTEHWAVAERQGVHAARAMLGAGDPYVEPPFFWTRQFGTSIAYVGSASRLDRVGFRGSVEEKEFLAGYYVDGRLVAAAGAGLSKQIIALGHLIGTGVEVPYEDFIREDADFLEMLHARATRHEGGHVK